MTDLVTKYVPNTGIGLTSRLVLNGVLFIAYKIDGGMIYFRMVNE